MGGFFGGLIAGALSDAHGERTALAIVAPLAAVVGGGLFSYGSRFIKRDISLAVEELLEEQAETRRMSAQPEDIPQLQVRNLDYSYGPVQVLFDVELEVRKGEVLALLGTNGAGKSTLLRALSGLGIPALLGTRRGAVAPARTEAVLDLFPSLATSRRLAARDLSGGQQQMLSLAMALLHDPELLLIDELSLGLAPVVVQELLGVVERLKGEGLTMVVVEQSVNVALAVADRAVFMEKGRIRFEGPAEELARRDDLVRAVFLGGEEG
jgi:ABC-type branched-subunit amino acid transport system ATPase component